MKVLIVSRGVPLKKYPLNGIFEFDQAKALRNIGLKVFVLACDFRSIRRWRKFGYFVTEEEEVTILNVSFPIGNIEIELLNRIARWLVRQGINRFLAFSEKPDIIHAHFSTTASLAIDIKKKFDIPLIITEHSSLINSNHIENNLFTISARTYKEANQVISVSQKLAKSLRFHFGLNPIVVPNIVDAKSFDSNPVYQNKVEDMFIFVSVGSLNYNKGFDTLLNAFANAHFIDDTRLVIFGAGDYKNNMVQLIFELGLEKSVILMGEQDRNAIAKELRKSNAFVLSSRSETFGVAFIEAMLMGLPVIGTRCGGPEEFINQENGILVDVDDVRGLTTALREMRMTSSKYDRSIISDIALHNYAPNVIAKKLIGIYESVI